MTDSKSIREPWNPGVTHAHRKFGPIAPPAGAAIALSDAESFAVTATIDAAEGERLGRQAIQEGLLRPADSHRADIETAQLVWIPLWRIDVVTDRSPREEGVVVLLARKLFPFDPSAKIELPLSLMTPRSTLGALEGEEIAADVTREEAIVDVRARMHQNLLPTRTQTVVQARSAAVCWYPVWLRRYVYEGGASRAPEECHVAISARTGKVVSAKHPSALGALKTRVTRLFRRG